VTDVRNYRLFPESRLIQPVTSGLLPQAWGRPDKSLAHLSDNIGATEVAARLTGDGVRALTAVRHLGRDASPDGQRAGAAPARE
jgi:hypothetical protein